MAENCELNGDEKHITVRSGDYNKTSVTDYSLLKSVRPKIL